MARAARYGNVQPSEFEAMDFRDGVELAKLVTEEYEGDFKRLAELLVAVMGGKPKRQG